MSVASVFASGLQAGSFNLPIHHHYQSGTPILRATGFMGSLDLGLCPKFIENSLPVLPGHGPIFLDTSMRESFWNGKKLFTTACPTWTLSSHRRKDEGLLELGFSSLKRNVC